MQIAYLLLLSLLEGLILSVLVFAVTVFPCPGGVIRSVWRALFLPLLRRTLSSRGKRRGCSLQHQAGGYKSHIIHLR
jgi:hypothetical protein